MILKMSKHAREERFDRACFIIDNIGFGDKVVFEGYAPDDGRGVRKMQITDTGIALVLDKEDNFIITFYIASIDLVTAVAGGRHIPQKLYAKVIENAKILKNSP